MISIIIPACNEESVIGDCLTHLLNSDMADVSPPQVVVVANGCHDDTVGRAQSHAAEFALRGWDFSVIDLSEGSKTKALNAGDAAARHELRAYIDADIKVSPGLIAALIDVLQIPEPAYASGQPEIRTKGGWFSDRYAKFWKTLPFMSQGVPGCGVYAVNGPARARWDTFPDIISDDSFVRCHFSPSERHQVDPSYVWPITAGFPSLVRVRRRQDQGLAELERAFPELIASSDPSAPDMMTKLKLLFVDPIGFVFYSCVAVAVRLPVFRNRTRWERRR